MARFDYTQKYTALLTAVTGSEWAGNVFKHFPVFTSHILTLSSNCKNNKNNYKSIYNTQHQSERACIKKKKVVLNKKEKYAISSDNIYIDCC